jgi:hypothetical protein
VKTSQEAIAPTTQPIGDGVCCPEEVVPVADLDSTVISPGTRQSSDSRKLTLKLIEAQIEVLLVSHCRLLAGDTTDEGAPTEQLLWLGRS